LLLFHYNNGCTNAPQRDCIDTLPVLFSSPRFICVVHPEEGNTAQDVAPALWACILDVSECILGCVANHTNVFRGFLELFLSNAKRGSHLGHDSFRTNPFQFLFINHVTAHAFSLRFRENHQAGHKTRRATDSGFLVTFVHLYQVHVGLEVLKYRDRNIHCQWHPKCHNFVIHHCRVLRSNNNIHQNTLPSK